MSKKKTYLTPPKNRIEFSERIIILLHEMLLAGEQPIIDWVMRSADEQYKLFRQGRSKLDGITKKSAHQLGKAMDIYLTDKDGKIIFEDRELYGKWHKRWEELGGKRMIDWDIYHFE